MCNFVIRPIKSYATIDVMASKVITSDNNVTYENHLLKRGTAFDVDRVDGGFVYGVVEGVAEKVVINTSDFTHTFTANPDSIRTVKEQESKFFKK